MKRAISLLFAIACVAGTAFVLNAAFRVDILGEDSAAVAEQKSTTTVRTENYPRPPYSGATYYIYERDDKVICTKLETCNKFGDCSCVYKKGAFKEQEDVETGDPYDKTAPVTIAAAKLKKHVCLTKFKLIP